MSRPLVPNISQYVVCATLLSLSATLAAQPRVEGNTINWPDDAWYQVQNATSYESMCEGGRDCQVADGRYFVINHSTGERFEGIDVPAQPSGDSVVVMGNTISWPDDGWYQAMAAA